MQRMKKFKNVQMTCFLQVGTNLDSKAFRILINVMDPRGK